MSNQPKIGLALGGGGARGLAHIGVLKALSQANIRIDMVVGVSMGAFMGACYVTGIGLDILEKEALSLTKRKAIRQLMDLSTMRRSILKGKKAFKYIDKILKSSNFSDTVIPFRIVATDLATGEDILITEGSLAKAVQASISVPGIFPPVKIGKRYLIDGGVSNPTPVNQVDRMGADIIIGVDLMTKRNVEIKEAPSLVASLIQSYEIIRTQAINYTVNGVAKKIIMIKPKIPGTIDSFRFYNIDQFIKAGEDAARKALPEIKKRIESFK